MTWLKKQKGNFPQGSPLKNEGHGGKPGHEHLKATQVEQKPTRRDSVVTAYHNKHIANKTPEYLNDPYYDKDKAEYKKVSEKFPELDTHMKSEKNRDKFNKKTPLKRQSNTRLDSRMNKQLEKHFDAIGEGKSTRKVKKHLKKYNRLVDKRYNT